MFCILEIHSFKYVFSTLFFALSINNNKIQKQKFRFFRIEYRPKKRKHMYINIVIQNLLRLLDLKHTLFLYKLTPVAFLEAL